VGGKNPVNLTKDSLADDTEPAYSPDGTYIAFRSERDPQGVYVMEATSENVRRVSDLGHNPSWSPDGNELAVSVDSSAIPTVRNRLPSALWIVNVASGAKRKLTDGDAVQPSWSPNGHRIAFWGVHSGGGRRDIWTISAGGGTPVPVTNDDALDINPVWSPDGNFLYFASDRGGSVNFWRVPIDERSGELRGEAEAITTPSGYSQDISFSHDSRQMAYTQKVETQNLYSLALDPETGKTSVAPEAIIQGTRFVTDADISPDGEFLAYSSQGERQEDIFIIKRDGSGQRQLTNDRFNDRSPRWSPDGSRLTFYSDRSGRYEVWLINVDGSGLQQLSFTSGASVFHPFWSPDGSRIAFKQRDESPYFFEVSKPWREQTAQQFGPLPAPQENFWPQAWSPDGRRIAGSCTYLGQHSLFLYSLETHSYEQIGPSGHHPFWFSDSRRLLYIDNGCIYSIDSETKKIRELVSLAPQEVRSVSLSKDNRRIFYTLKRTEADVWLLSLDR
jgi:Tol biopolymer transport system component